MSYKYDQQDNAPIATEFNKTLIYYQNWSGTSRDPKLELTYATAAADNAVFFGTNF